MGKGHSKAFGNRFDSASSSKSNRFARSKSAPSRPPTLADVAIHKMASLWGPALKKEMSLESSMRPNDEENSVDSDEESDFEEEVIMLSNEELSAMWRKYDSTDRGFLTKDQICSLVKDLVRVIFEDEPKKCNLMVEWVEDPLFGVDQIMHGLDDNGDGKVTEDEFLKNYGVILQREEADVGGQVIIETQSSKKLPPISRTTTMAFDSFDSMNRRRSLLRRRATLAINSVRPHIFPRDFGDGPVLSIADTLDIGTSASRSSCRSSSGHGFSTDDDDDDDGDDEKEEDFHAQHIRSFSNESNSNKFGEEPFGVIRECTPSKEEFEKRTNRMTRNRRATLAVGTLLAACSLETETEGGDGGNSETREMMSWWGGNGSHHAIETKDNRKHVSLDLKDNEISHSRSQLDPSKQPIHVSLSKLNSSNPTTSPSFPSSASSGTAFQPVGENPECSLDTDQPSLSNCAFTTSAAAVGVISMIDNNAAVSTSTITPSPSIAPALPAFHSQFSSNSPLLQSGASPKHPFPPEFPLPSSSSSSSGGVSTYLQDQKKFGNNSEVVLVPHGHASQNTGASSETRSTSLSTSNPQILYTYKSLPSLTSPSYSKEQLNSNNIRASPQQQKQLIQQIQSRSRVQSLRLGERIKKDEMITPPLRSSPASRQIVTSRFKQNLINHSTSIFMPEFDKNISELDSEVPSEHLDIPNISPDSISFLQKPSSDLQIPSSRRSLSWDDGRGFVPKKTQEHKTSHRHHSSASRQTTNRQQPKDDDEDDREETHIPNEMDTLRPVLAADFIVRRPTPPPPRLPPPPPPPPPHLPVHSASSSLVSSSRTFDDDKSPPSSIHRTGSILYSDHSPAPIRAPTIPFAYAFISSTSTSNTTSEHSCSSNSSWSDDVSELECFPIEGQTGMFRYYLGASDEEDDGNLWLDGSSSEDDVSIFGEDALENQNSLPIPPPPPPPPLFPPPPPPPSQSPPPPSSSLC